MVKIVIQIMIMRMKHQEKVMIILLLSNLIRICIVEMSFWVGNVTVVHLDFVIFEISLSY